MKQKTQDNSTERLQDEEAKVETKIMGGKDVRAVINATYKTLECPVFSEELLLKNIGEKTGGRYGIFPPKPIEEGVSLRDKVYSLNKEYSTKPLTKGLICELSPELELGKGALNIKDTMNHLRKLSKLKNLSLYKIGFMPREFHDGDRERGFATKDHITICLLADYTIRDPPEEHKLAGFKISPYDRKSIKPFGDLAAYLGLSESLSIQWRGPKKWEKLHGHLTPGYMGYSITGPGKFYAQYNLTQRALRDYFYGVVLYVNTDNIRNEYTSINTKKKMGKKGSFSKLTDKVSGYFKKEK